MIGVGLVMVLLLQLVFSFFAQKEAEMRNKANFYIDRGSAEVMEWGSKDYVKAYDGGVILEGDSIRTKAASRGILSLYNGTEIRFSENTSVTVSTLDNKGDTDYLVLDLYKGEIWVDQVVNERGSTDVLVKIDNMNIHSTGTQFAVLNRESQVVRVVDNSVQVELLDGNVVIDDVTVGVGQELFMSASDVEDLLARKNMDFLAAISNEWEEGDFYEWSVEYQVMSTQSQVDVESGTGEVVMEEIVIPDLEAEEEVDYDDPVLTLTNPKNSPYLLEGEAIDITGDVAGYASKVVVTSYSQEGTATEYELNLFEPGDESFRYSAAISYENLYEGENEFLVTAYDYYGLEADTMSLTVNVESQDSSTQSQVEEESEVDSDDYELACDLTAPVITDIDWEEHHGEVFELTDADAVRIDGTSECAYGIVINGYQLTLFEPGSTTWAYVASVEYNNLSEGENVYEVFAVDEDGNRSDAVYFEVNYVPSEDSR